MATTINRLMTFAEFERLPDAPDGRYELRRGELVKVPFPEHGHYPIRQRLRDLLAAAAGRSGIVAAEFGFRALPEHEYRRADVALVSPERWVQMPRDSYFEGAPEIVIEVLSPSRTAAEMLDKEQLCLENGAKEFWVVDPVHQQVKVSTSDGRTAIWKSGRQIPLFFGGAIPVDAIFREAPRP